MDVLSAWNESLRFLDFDPTNVEELTQRAFEKSPSHIPTLKLSYHVYESIGKHDEAKKVKDRILELIPNFEEMEADRRKLLLNENAWLREMVN